MRVRLLEWSLMLALGAGLGACGDKSACSGVCESSMPTPTPSSMGDPDMGVSSTGNPDMAMSSGDCCSNPDMGVPAGPWPTADLTVYGSAQGLGGIIDASPDDEQNIWAVAKDTLYVLRPGQTTFQKFTAADGLHIGPFTDFYGNPNMTWITAMAGGEKNTVYVGYYGYEDENDPFQDTEAQKELGNADKVVLDPATGKITITRYLFRCDYDAGGGCWEDRSPRRMIFAHQGVADGHLFIGFNHGVAHVFQDQFGDHVHPEITWHNPDGSTVEKIGEFYGIAVVPSTGDLWTAGRYGVGLQEWNATPHFKWVDMPFRYAFTIYGAGHGLDVPANYTEENSGAAVMPDGSVYISSFTRGLTHWDPATGNYGTMTQVSGVPQNIADIAADPDGTLWIVDTDGTLSRYNPANGSLMPWPNVSGAHRVVVDSTVTPRAVYVSTDGGLAVIRAK